MVEYTNNSAKVKTAINTAVKNFLTEAGGEIQAATIRNSRTDTGQTKGSYEYKVVTGNDEGTVYVGSNYQNAIWEEYGTGEYALQGNGRKTPWVYKDRFGKWHRTKGKTPNKPLKKAFDSLSGKLEARLAAVLKSI